MEVESESTESTASNSKFTAMSTLRREIEGSSIKAPKVHIYFSKPRETDGSIIQLQLSNWI